MNSLPQRPQPSSSSGPLTLVVQANPDYPPWALLLLANHLRGQGQIVNVANHVHSSLTSKLAGALSDAFTSDEICEERQRVRLNVTVIWKGNCKFLLYGL